MNKREINKILKLWTWKYVEIVACLMWMYGISTESMKVCSNSSLFDVNVRDKYWKYESMLK